MKQGIAIFAAWLSLAVSPALAGEDRPAVVVELFTSQGCMSCPPADKVLAELSKDSDIVALSWPIDYWDYLGWKDTFATPANSERQRMYNWQMGRRGVYTPQMILNGRKQGIGSREGEIRAMIADLKKSGGLPVNVSLSGTQDALQVTIDSSNSSLKGDVTIWMVMFDSERVVDIHYGENRGRSLHYANIVRDAKTIGKLDGAKTSVTLDLASENAIGAECLAILVQQGDAGPILGATKTALADFD